MPQLNRRAFVVRTAAAGAGLALGFDVPFGGPTVVRAADGEVDTLDGGNGSDFILDKDGDDVLEDPGMICGL